MTSISRHDSLDIRQRPCQGERGTEAVNASPVAFARGLQSRSGTSICKLSDGCLHRQLWCRGWGQAVDCHGLASLCELC